MSNHRENCERVASANGPLPSAVILLGCEMLRNEELGVMMASLERTGIGPRLHDEIGIASIQGEREGERERASEGECVPFAILSGV